ncbi:MAG: hypothetical protein OHM77_10840 [Candidatus Nitricoxidivorans perseverans]|uniref:Uncharacterized protein n=1 Tax=Candidatus Nitricoxidivorans perseverans TaxID=2975601 RepID=A0AA49ITN1_9PROT|nr:MAG: hypothetical protein OHM77_10840 [Candidatus Nitricoxidivorans perseverans]
MDVERARLLRDRERGLHRPHCLAPQPGTRKHREIRFAKLPPGQAEEARAFLTTLSHLEIAPGLAPNSLSVWYEIGETTLKELESALLGKGFNLSNTLICKLMRALVYYCEETQLDNLRRPTRLLKDSNEVYSRAWEHHPHGDHDDTPPDFREER